MKTVGDILAVVEENLRAAGCVYDGDVVDCHINAVFAAVRKALEA